MSRGPNDFDWDEAAVEKLKALWKTPMSAAQIAGEIASTLTRNAVIGKAQRLGLPTRRKLATVRAKATNMAKAPKRRAASSSDDDLKAEPVPVMGADVPPEQRVKLLDLKPDTCRFFCGDVGQPDAGFCPAAAVPGTSWCAAHGIVVWAGPRQAYRPPTVGRIVSGLGG